MSDFLKTQALKMAVNVIGIDNITSAIESFMQQAIAWARQQPLLQNETKVVGILYENSIVDIETLQPKGEIYYAAVTLDDEARICRYLIDEPIKNIIAQLLENIS